MTGAGVFIAERFRKAVLLHVIKNLDPTLGHTTPLYLGIGGPSGEGKTFQTLTVLRELGVEVQRLSGGELESKEAAEPVAKVRYAYLKAGESLKSPRGIAAMLIDDIDTSIGNWGDQVQYTVNRQIVIGELMHLADVPTIVNGRPALRVPVIFTGNDFTKLYAPLIRAGRMTSFEWIPTFDERVYAVNGIFPALTATETYRLVTLVERKRSRSRGSGVRIAFYSHLRSAVVDDRVWQDVSTIGVPKVVERVRTGFGYGSTNDISLSALESAALALLKSETIKNYLAVG